MRYFSLFLIATLLLFQAFDANAQKMDNKRLGKILTEVTDSIQGKEGSWQIIYEDITMFVITDQKHNRMRIITPIAYISELDESVYKEALEANFHTALDVKYAISDNIMWTVFIHPLKELSENQVKDAIKQVYYGTKTFGGSYSSSDLFFPFKES